MRSISGCLSFAQPAARITAVAATSASAGVRDTLTPSIMHIDLSFQGAREMTSTIVRFPATQGHDLAARLEMPAGKPRAYAVFAHCFTCSKDSKGAAFISQALAGRGIAVLRFDFTGLGQSGGEFADSSFSSNVDDIVCAARFLREKHSAPQILIGHSLGGAAVLAAAGEISEARAIATIGSPYDPRHVEHLLTNKDELLAKGEATVDIGGRPFKMRRQFLDDLE